MFSLRIKRRDSFDAENILNFINLPFYEMTEDGLQVNFLTHDRLNIFIGDGGKNMKEEMKSVG